MYDQGYCCQNGMNLPFFFAKSFQKSAERYHPTVLGATQHV